MNFNEGNITVGQNWVPKMHLQSDMTIEERQKDDYNRRICCILNKVTPQNFRKLLMQIMNLNINSTEKIEIIIQFVFRKCIDANLYSEVYAHFCIALMDQIKTTSLTHASLFSSLLYREIGKIFAIILNTKEPEKNTFGERHQMFCSIIFIGQLYNKNFISDAYLHGNFLKQLLVNDSGASQKKYEYQLECLCKILQITGHNLEKQQNKEHIDRYFQELENIYNMGNISTRIKMLLLNLIELRASNWFDRKRKEKPVTMDQIRSQKGG